MFCPNCGKPIPENSSFCAECGTKVTNQTERSPKTVKKPGPKTSAPAKRKIGNIIISLTAVVLIAVIVVSVVLIMGSPKLTLAKAVKNSMGAWEDAMESVGVSAGELKEKPVRNSGVLQLTELELGRMELEFPKTAQLRWETAANMPDEEMAAQVTIVMGDTDIFSLYVGLQDILLTVYSPELLGNQALEVNTETAEEDFKRLGVSGNLWQWSRNVSQQEDSSLLSVAENPSDFKGVAVKKQEKSTQQVNGYSIECVRYTMSVPADLALSVLHRWEELLAAREEDDTKLLGRVGNILPQVFYAMEPEGDAPLELDFYLRDRQVMAIVWRDPAGERELRLSIGGGSRYVDDWGLEAKTEEGTLSIRSSGDHGANAGSLTDRTVLTCNDRQGTTSAAVDVQYRLEDGDLQMQVEHEGFVLEMQGNATRENGRRTLTVENLTVGDSSLKLHFSGSTTQLPYEPIPVPAETILSLAEMEPEDMKALEENVEESISQWKDRLLKALLGSLGIPGLG